MRRFMCVVVVGGEGEVGWRGRCGEGDERRAGR